MKPDGARFMPDQQEVQMALEHLHRYQHAALMSENKCVLDIACGSGYGSGLLARNAKLVVGVDREAEAVQYASSTYTTPNCFFVQACATMLPFPDCSFDLVVSFETIEHLSGNEQGCFLENAHRTLKQDGCLLISTPDRHLYAGAEGLSNPFHLHELDEEEFRDRLSEYFSEISIFRQQVGLTSLMLDGSKEPTIPMGFDRGEGGWFRTVHDPDQSGEYMIAICSSQKEGRTVHSSVMIDLHGESKTETVSLRRELYKARQNIDELANEIQQARENHRLRDEEEQNLHSRIAELEDQLGECRQRPAAKEGSASDSIPAEPSVSNKRTLRLGRMLIKSERSWRKKLQVERAFGEDAQHQVQKLEQELTGLRDKLNQELKKRAVENEHHRLQSLELIDKWRTLHESHQRLVLVEQDGRLEKARMKQEMTESLNTLSAEKQELVRLLGLSQERLDTIRGQLFYRLLKKLRLLKEPE